MTQTAAALRAKYPKIFPNGAPVFDCKDGWLDLIDRLCARLQAAADAGQIDQPIAVQVKEKFGTMKFYAYPRAGLALNWTREAERASGTVCEVCGAPGQIRRSGLCFMTRCDACAPAGAAIYDRDKDGDVPWSGVACDHH